MLMKRIGIASAALAGLVIMAPARGDNLAGADKFLCSANSTTVSCDDGQCASGTATELDIPQFIEVDVVGKRVSTTKASGLNRTSPVDNLKRVNGRIVLQGLENDRAYSIVIDEKTGELAAAVAAPGGCAVTAFGICTPMPASK
jgi:hypothetical protein